MSSTVTPTAAQRRLLELPIYAALATVRPDGTPQVNPMWFAFDGEHLRFTHLRTRQKFRNLQANDGMAVSLLDPDNPFSYLEIRGRLVEVIDDPTGPSTSNCRTATATRAANRRRMPLTASFS